MNLLGSALVLALIGFPIAWIVSEFRCGRGVRILLGINAMAVVTVAASTLWATLLYLQYNADFGFATQGLIDASIEQIEDGHLDRVLKAWRGLNAPPYENRARYPELAAEATALIRGEKPFTPGTRWDAGPFDRETWAGHWESDTGHWIVVDRSVLSVYGPERMQAVTLSDDFKTLTFHKGGQWRHTLTLIGKSELTHEWFDLTRQQVWRTEPMHKLVRAIEEQVPVAPQDARESKPGP
ncbi:hypothetical protein VT85_00655 [Planctomyces sp. SH-PL62]|nr:hypothetical protein VT85_00655 [Planctomyces sp. SH-PL62]